MTRNPFRMVAGLLGLAFLLAAGGLTALSALRLPPAGAVFPDGTVIAGIPVHGLSAAEAQQRVETAYAVPIELHYQDNRIQAGPDMLGFALETDAMLAQARQPLERSWQDRFWDTLWNRPPPAGAEVPLQASVDLEKARAFLENEVAPRYDSPPQAPFPTSSTGFQAGQPGWELDIEPALPLIESALLSLTNRSVDLQVVESPAPPVTLELLQDVLIAQIINSGFGGIVTIALTDMQTGEELYFAVQGQEQVDPEIAFTAASTIKIPIMLSVLKRTPEPTPEGALALLERMAILSENPPADQLMERYINEFRGPLVVTEDMQALGLRSTFLAGYFYTGAPLLDWYETPANTRTDINLKPDVYNQTTPGEMRDLMAWIYTCAAGSDGPIKTAFGEDVSQAECQLILDLMARNKNALLLEAGIPDDTRVAHKHGWVEEADGLLHTMCDVGVVFTPGGDYAVSIFLYQPERLDFDSTNNIVARLSLAIYNAFNIDAQYPWMPYPEN